ncbi:MAG: purine-nucleoside phosphorylase [Sumerlaeia bacterium]
MSLYDQIQKAAAFIQGKVSASPTVGVICGTGMGALGDAPEGLVKIPYGDIPHFPVSTVESHHGFLCCGKLSGKQAVVMQGRFHRYEGYSLQQVTFPVRVMKALGVETLIIMNAVGSVNPLIKRGSLMLVTDHINLMGDNPLIGPNDERLGSRFPDMSEPYNLDLVAKAEAVALENKIRVERGVAVAVTGPNLETRAEYRMFQRIGADIVTMSTIPENIVAVHTGLKVMALSTITDECYPEALKPVDVSEIIEVAMSREADRQAIVRGVIAGL